MDKHDKHDKHDKPHKPGASDDSVSPTDRVPRIRLVDVKFAGVAMVCSECEDRGSGPKKLKAKDVRKELKRNSGQLSTRFRIVECSCLGMCPKGAIAVVAMARGKPLRAAEICTAEEASGLLFALERGDAAE